MNPVAQQRRLRNELRRLRESSKKTQQEVANELEWSLSKIIRIETGVVGITKTDLIVLLQTYGVTDPARIEELTQIARASREEVWWDRYRQYFDRRFITFLGLEAEATIIRHFNLLLIPGLLQTPDYARAVMNVYENDPEVIDRGVKVRLERQKLLDRTDGGPEMFFILDEAAIHRAIGGPAVMREQLTRLQELNRNPDISIQIIPFSKGAHVGMWNSFSVLEFNPDNNDYAVEIDLAHSTMLIQNDAEESSKYVETFYTLERLASPKEDLDSIINRVIEESFPDSGT